MVNTMLRTSMELRSQKKIVDTKIKASEIKGKQYIKMGKSSPVEITNGEKKKLSNPITKSLGDQIIEIECSLKNHREKIERMFAELKVEINDKFDHIGAQFLTIESDRRPKVISTSIIPYVDSNKHCKQHQMKLDDDELFKTSIILFGKEINSKIAALQKHDEKIEATLSDIIHTISSTKMFVDESEKITECDHYGEIDDLRNAIECMQVQLNKAEIMSIENAERNSKINHHVHVLSAMFVKFNAQINNHVLDFNKRAKEEINVSKIIDKNA